ncbi:hypothetical protein C4J81_09150 [Deltaproteobacteria bacterium Smac51]|nr:hypothetical protein C4J81_09150 [Deltaproteobacteria bacterium Smac51]
MTPDQPLTIYEVRALDSAAFDLFETSDPMTLLGKPLAGLHWEADFAFLFFKGEPGEAADDFLKKHPNLELRQVHNLTYAQWQDGAGFEPFQAGGLTVTGPHEAAAGPHVIIDPGLAFGFGGHPTTRACLDFLGRVCRSPEGPPKEALDLGSGTGILSLAAAVLGVEKAFGVDYSHMAVAASLDNLALNHLADRVEFVRDSALNHACRRAGLLMANLNLALQRELFAAGAFEARRWIIVSGLLTSEGEKFLEMVSPLPLKLTDQIRTDRWTTILMEPK